MSGKNTLLKNDNIFWLLFTSLFIFLILTLATFVVTLIPGYADEELKTKAGIIALSSIPIFIIGMFAIHEAIGFRLPGNESRPSGVGCPE